MLINGKKIADDIHQEIKLEVKRCEGKKPCLAVILVGDNPASKIYVKKKIKACQEVGIKSIAKQLPESIGENALIQEIHLLNENSEVDGILVQLPLPKEIDESKIINTIDPDKDVDGFHPFNVGKSLNGDKDGFVSCTPLGIQEMLIRSGITTQGKHAVILGRSNIVGKPMATLLMQRGAGGDATVTLTHRFTRNLDEICRMADILIVAIGKPKFITKEMVKKGAVIIDVGINKVDGRIVGDVDFDAVKDRCSHITPVPGGVGPMTIAMLLKNTLKSHLKRVSPR